MDVEEATYYEEISDVENEESFDGGNSGRKRSYHNILERKRRNHIKDGYLTLRDAVPNIYGKKVSRIQILKKAIEYIRAQKEENTKREESYREMKKRSEFLKKAVDFMKTKDLTIR